MDEEEELNRQKNKNDKKKEEVERYLGVYRNSEVPDCLRAMESDACNQTPSLRVH